MSQIKAYVTTVNIGNLSLEGLMSEDGEYFVAALRLAERFQFDKVQASRRIKYLVGQNASIVKLKTPFSPKPVNAIRLKDIKNVVFALAQSGNADAIVFWNQAFPDIKFKDTKIKLRAKDTKIKFCDLEGINESRVEDFVMELYKNFSPSRQVITDFGRADVVHDHGVVEIKEYKSIRSAHTAIGQAMSYASILNKQPEVILFNVPTSEIDRLLRMFTAIGMLVLIYDIDDTVLIVDKRKWYPTASNSQEIQFQIAQA